MIGEAEVENRIIASSVWYIYSLYGRRDLICLKTGESDTTAATMRAIVLYVATNPHVYKVLMQEIRSAEAMGKISQPIKHQEAQALPYLQADIREGIRIHPEIGTASPRGVPAGGANICGFFIPEGMWIGMAPWALSRHRETYGQDPVLFVPERWLENEERSKYREKIDINFGAGYCWCLGKNIAVVEINKAIVEVSLRDIFDMDYILIYRCNTAV